MGTGIRYSDEFKQEAVNQVILHGYGLSGGWATPLTQTF